MSEETIRAMPEEVGGTPPTAHFRRPYGLGFTLFLTEAQARAICPYLYTEVDVVRSRRNLVSFKPVGRCP